METKAPSTARITLDWSKLLGFDQVAEQVAVTRSSSLADPRLARIGAKVGVKPVGHPSPG